MAQESALRTDPRDRSSDRQPAGIWHISQVLDEVLATYDRRQLGRVPEPVPRERPTVRRRRLPSTDARG